MVQKRQAITSHPPDRDQTVSVCTPTPEYGGADEINQRYQTDYETTARFKTNP